MAADNHGQCLYRRLIAMYPRYLTSSDILTLSLTGALMTCKWRAAPVSTDSY